MFVENQEQLSQCNFSGSVIGVDTEFVRESDIKPILCLLQIATENDVFIIDPINIDLTYLKPIFENENITKIFHDARQDIEILNLYDIHVQNFYDTQIAEMFCSPKETESYPALVLKYLGKKISKNQTLSNWTTRPLSKKQLKYAAADVAHLIEIYTQQTNKLRKLNRCEWLQEFMTDNHEEDDDILQKLLNWREKKSTEVEKSPDDVVKPNLLRAVHRKGLHFIHQLQNSRTITDPNELAFIDFAATIVPNYERKYSSDMLYLLRTLLVVCAQKHNICSAVIAHRNDLENILTGKDSVCMHGWRFEIFGKYARQLLNGEIRLGIENKKVVMI